MNGCDEIRGLLEEYFDRELPPARMEAVRSHVRDCASCAAALADLERLERTLLASPPGAELPDAGAFVGEIRQRTAFTSRSRWQALLPLAAAVLLTFGLTRMLTPVPSPAKGAETLAKIQNLLDLHEQADAAGRVKLEAEIDRLGFDGIAAVVSTMLGDPNPARQKTAVTILASRSKDKRVADLMVARSTHAPDAAGWSLSEIGVESDDNEMVGPAIELARNEGTSEDAIKILRKIDRGSMNKSAHREIVRQVRDLLASGIAKEQLAGLRIVRGLEILEEDVVEFLDVPELREETLKFLKARTGQDHGFDKGAWRTMFATRKL